jgi:RNA polymerase sigma factor (sigma-70 family)
MSESDLIDRCRKKEAKAQRDLHAVLYKKYIGLCWRFAGDKELAVEYFNIGFVRILLQLDKYRSDVPFDFWSKRVLVNAIINEYKRNRRWAQRNLPMEKEYGNHTEEHELSDLQWSMVDRIKAAAGNLSPMTQRVFNLYAVDGYKHYEIAEMLGISEGTSAWHYSEAKRKIRKWIGVNEDE